MHSHYQPTTPALVTVNEQPIILHVNCANQ